MIGRARASRSSYPPQGPLRRRHYSWFWLACRKTYSHRELRASLVTRSFAADGDQRQELQRSRPGAMAVPNKGRFSEFFGWPLLYEISLKLRFPRCRLFKTKANWQLNYSSSSAGFSKISPTPATDGDRQHTAPSGKRERLRQYRNFSQVQFGRQICRIRHAGIGAGNDGNTSHDRYKCSGGFFIRRSGRWDGTSSE